MKFASNPFDNPVLFTERFHKQALELAVGNKTDLVGSNFHGVDLSDTNLSGADFFESNFSWANLENANLSYVNFMNTNLFHTKLTRANLFGTNLSGANLAGANLDETVLDPKRNPNGDCKGFKALDKEWVIGYRTRQTSAAGGILVDDRIYGVEVFSTCETECHPGWYLWPTLEEAVKFSGKGKEFIEIKARKIDIHKTATKWRSRAIWIIKTIKD